MRIISLLPAATEIVGVIGQLPNLVGVSHECDYPVGASALPRVTHCEIHESGLPSGQVDDWVRSSLAESGTLYTLDDARIRELAPDVILTQRLCDVCAVGYGSVAALAAALPKQPLVVNLEPACLADIFANIRQVADVLEVPEAGQRAVAALNERVMFVQETVERAEQRPSCLLLEWIEPPFCSGHWGPELVELAGGIEPVGRKGAPSTRIPWEEVVQAAPEVIVAACCGYTAERTLLDLPIAASVPGWQTIPAVRDGRVFAANGSAYFSRPGPRSVDSLEILAEILHPELFAGQFPDRGVVQVSGS